MLEKLHSCLESLDFEWNLPARLPVARVPKNSFQVYGGWLYRINGLVPGLFSRGDSETAGLQGPYILLISMLINIELVWNYGRVQRYATAGLLGVCYRQK